MNVILYTTHCPRCRVLAAKLDKANISYEINDDIEELIEAGFHSAPVLKVGETMMNFTEANKWIGEQN